MYCKQQEEKKTTLREMNWRVDVKSSQAVKKLRID